MPRIFIYHGRCIFICRAMGVTSVFPEKPLHGSSTTVPFSRSTRDVILHFLTERAALRDAGIMTLYNRVQVPAK